MNYTNGLPIKLGDQVRLSNGETGTVVFCIDTDDYSKDFPKEEWAYLKVGVMVRTNNGALIHFSDPNRNDVMPI